MARISPSKSIDIYPCPSCERVFLEKGALNGHKQAHTENQSK